jgi:hypothetical protein
MLTITPDPATPVGPYAVGDQPPAVTVAVLDDAGDPVDLTAEDTATAALVAPPGTSVALVVTIDPANEDVAWTWPVNPFPLPGLFSVALTLTGRDPVEALPIVVEALDGWLTLAMARRLWPDAPRDDVALFLLLDTARVACEAYAPALDVGVAFPSNYLEAQLAQARSVWNLMQTAPQTDAIGYDQTAVRVYPLDYNVRQLLRPKTGKPVMW